MLARITVVLALSGLCLVIAGPISSRLQLLPPMLGLVIFLLSALLGLAALVLAAIVAIRQQAYFPALIGTLGLIPLLAVAATAVQGKQYPAINDITTNLEAPPLFKHAQTIPENVGRDLSFPVEFSETIASYYDDLSPLKLPLAPDTVYSRALEIARDKPFDWSITSDDSETFTLEAVAETRLFRWKDDIVIQVSRDANDGSVVNMRSKSREGRSDLGANARRIRAFFEALRD
jgi:uncharacterized protein (DUF1499 family)